MQLQPLESDKHVRFSVCVPHAPHVAVHAVALVQADQIPFVGQQEELTAAVVGVGIVHGVKVVVVN